MNIVHLHLLINHFPIIGSVIGVLILSLGIILGKNEVRRVGMFVLLGAAILAIPTNMTGERSEHLVEKIAGINEEAIELHEEWAEVYIKCMFGGILLSAIALFLDFKKHIFAHIARIIVCVYFIISLFLAKQVGTSGGEIRHPEISNTPTNISPLKRDREDEDH